MLFAGEMERAKCYDAGDERKEKISGLKKEMELVVRELW